MNRHQNLRCIGLAELRRFWFPVAGLLGLAMSGTLGGANSAPTVSPKQSADAVAERENSRPVVLRYAPSVRALRYHYTMDTTSTGLPDGGRGRSASGTTMTMTVTVTSVAPDRLQAALSCQNVICLVGGRRRDVQFANETLAWEMRPNGELTWVGARYGFDVEPLIHRLKDSPAQIGDSWTGPEFAIDRSPPPVTVLYRLDSIRSDGSVRCAFITWTAKADWPSPGANGQFHVASRGQVVFDCDAGRIRTMISQVDTEFRAKDRVIQQHVEQTMQLL